MLKEHRKLVARILVFTDLAATVLSFHLAYIVRSHYRELFNLTELDPLHKYAWLLLIILPLWTTLLYRFQAYKSFRTTLLRQEMAPIYKAVVLGGFVFTAVAFGLKLHYLSRAFIATFIVINLVFLTLERYVIRRIGRSARRRGYNFRKVVIVGTNGAAKDVAARVEKYRHWGLRIVGFVSENGYRPDEYYAGHKILGTLADLESIVKDEVVDEVIFAVEGREHGKYEEAFLMLEDYGISARISVNMFPHVIAQVRLDELDTIPLLTFSTVPADVQALAMKRALDLVVAVLLSILSAPVVLITSLLVKVTSPGPVFFKQKRCGLNGRIFTLYKFRSMYEDAEARKAELAARNELTGPAFKMKNDPRVTKVGRFIRNTSIDELPQLWNVLRGDMSMVGPRPPLPDEVAQYARWQRRKLSMRPGLTCIWQVSGRNTVKDFNEWVKLDLQYIDTWSNWLDLKIVAMTIPTVLFRKGAA